MTSAQLRDLHKALLQAFPAADFERLLRTRLDVNMHRLVGAMPFDSAVFEVLQFAERAGWTHELVRAAYEERPGHQALAAVYGELGLAPGVSVQSAGVEDPGEAHTVAAPSFGQGRALPFLDLGLWRERLTLVEGRVGRVEIHGSMIGTGFLVGPGAVLCTYHGLDKVFTGAVPPSGVRLRFDYKKLSDGSVASGTAVGLAPQWLIDASPYAPDEATDEPDRQLPTPDELDYALLALDSPVGGEPPDLSASGTRPRGWLRVPERLSPLAPGAFLLIAHYPQGEPLKVTIDTDAVLGPNANGTRVRYKTMTAPGSTGAPCFDVNWNLVAMHHRRDPATIPQYRQGIPITAIRDRLIRVGKVGALGGEPP